MTAPIDAQQIRDFIAENPNLRPFEVAYRLKIPAAFVRQAMGETAIFVDEMPGSLKPYPDHPPFEDDPRAFPPREPMKQCQLEAYQAKIRGAKKCR
jgi:hypothetical protein